MRLVLVLVFLLLEAPGQEHLSVFHEDRAKESRSAEVKESFADVLLLVPIQQVPCAYVRMPPAGAQILSFLLPSVREIFFQKQKFAPSVRRAKKEFLSVHL